MIRKVKEYYFSPLQNYHLGAFCIQGLIHKLCGLSQLANNLALASLFLCWWVVLINTNGPGETRCPRCWNSNRVSISLLYSGATWTLWSLMVIHVSREGSFSMNVDITWRERERHAHKRRRRTTCFTRAWNPSTRWMSVNDRRHGALRSVPCRWSAPGFARRSAQPAAAEQREGPGAPILPRLVRLQSGCSSDCPRGVWMRRGGEEAGAHERLGSNPNKKSHVHSFLLLTLIWTSCEHTPTSSEFLFFFFLDQGASRLSWFFFFFCFYAVCPLRSGRKESGCTH